MTFSCSPDGLKYLINLVGWTCSTSNIMIVSKCEAKLVHHWTDFYFGCMCLHVHVSVSCSALSSQEHHSDVNVVKTVCIIDYTALSRNVRCVQKPNVSMVSDTLIVSHACNSSWLKTTSCALINKDVCIPDFSYVWLT